MPSPRRQVEQVNAMFKPDDASQAPWSGSLRQTITTRMLDAGGELIEGTSKIEWDRPNPPVNYFPTAEGELTIDGHNPCRVFWGNDRFNHSGGWDG